MTTDELLAEINLISLEIERLEMLQQQLLDYVR